MADVSGTFTSASATVAMIPKTGVSVSPAWINIAITGTFFGTIALERSFDGVTWIPANYPGSANVVTFTTPGSVSLAEPEAGVAWRLNATAWTSGAANYRISADSAVKSQAPFTPLSTSPYIWLDPSDLSTMFQDTAGTIPVTADGDPVALIRDKSGNGKDAVQATASKRPLYKTDGTLRWLLFDGVDDCLQVPSITLPTYLYVCIGLDPTNQNVSTPRVTHGLGVGSNPGFTFCGWSSTWAVNRGAGAYYAIGTASWVGNTALVADFRFDASGGEYRRNGVAQANGTIGGTAPSNSDVTAALNIGSENQTASFTNGAYYGLFISPSMADRAASVAWMSPKVGL